MGAVTVQCILKKIPIAGLQDSTEYTLRREHHPIQDSVARIDAEYQS